MSITDFLNARIAEDEAVARAAAESKLMHNAAPWPAVEVSHTWTADHGMIYTKPAEGDEWGHMLYDNEGASALSMPTEAADHIARHDPARVLAECAAKRAIVERYERFYATRRANWMNPNYVGAMEELKFTLETLAAVYADHPEYLDEWKVGA